MIDEWYWGRGAHTDPNTRIIVTGTATGFCTGADVMGGLLLGSLQNESRSAGEPQLPARRLAGSPAWSR